MEVILKQLVNKAAIGDYRSIQLVISFVEKHPLVNRESTTITAAELEEKTNLLRDAVGVLRKLGVLGTE